MRHWLRNFVLLAIAATAPGCVAFEDYRYHHSKRAEARQAWLANRQNNGSACRDYAEGWKMAYYEMATGSNGALPAIAPQKYWAPKYQNAAGQAAIEAFFVGYQDGVLAANHDGVSLWNGVPTSGFAALACQAPPVTEPSLPLLQELLPEPTEQFDGAILDQPELSSGTAPAAFLLAAANELSRSPRFPLTTTGEITSPNSPLPQTASQRDMHPHPGVLAVDALGFEAPEHRSPAAPASVPVHKVPLHDTPKHDVPVTFNADAESTEIVAVAAPQGQPALTDDAPTSKQIERRNPSPKKSNPTKISTGAVESPSLEQWLETYFLEKTAGNVERPCQAPWHHRD